MKQPRNAKLNKKFVQKSQIFTNFTDFGSKYRNKYIAKFRLLDSSKRGHSAESSTLLLSALRPRLCGVADNHESSNCTDNVKFRNCSINSLSNSNYRFLKCAFCLFGILTIILGLQMLVTDNVSAASLTLEVPSTISLNITPASSGTFAKSSAKNISVKTDAPWGYNLTIKGKSSDAALVSGSSKLTSISSNLTEEQFKTTTKNTWGYLPSKVGSSANTTFRPGPSTTATTIDKTSSANSSTANSYSITLGAKVDNTIPSGGYTNTFTLTSVANSVSYNITYNLNSGSWSGKSPQTGSTVNNTITLDSHTPTKSNYTFQGWCTSSSISNNNTTSTPSCNGTKYNAGATYNLSNSSNTVNLYAMWKSNVTYRSYTIYYNSSIGSPSNMPSTQSGSAASTDSYRITLRSNTPSMTNYSFQGWCTSSSITNNGTTSTPSCNGSKYQPGGSYTIGSNGTTVNLYAMWKQNGTSYSIAYNCNSGTPCPSTQSGVSTSGNVTLSSTTPSKSGYTFQGWCSTSPSGNNTTSVSCSGYTYQPSGSYPLSRGTNVTLYAMWKKTWSSGGNSNNFECTLLGSTGSTSSIKDTRDGKTYSIAKLADGKCWMTQNLNYTGNSSYTRSQYGAYYSWENSKSACPSGWRLPSESEFRSLLSAYGNNYNGELLKSPANFVLSGYYSHGSFYDAGRHGLWWSPDSNGWALYLLANGGGVYNTGSDGAYYSVRCVSSQ